MQTLQAEKIAKKVEEVQLVKGEFTPSEAWDIISSLIDVKVNFHKLQRLQRWEGSHNCETGDLNNRIDELKSEEASVKEFIKQLRQNGKNLKISGTLQITEA